MPQLQHGHPAAEQLIYSATTGVTLSFDAYLASLGLPLAPTQHVWQLFSMSADGSAISGMYYDTATSTSSAFLLHTIRDDVLRDGFEDEG